MLKQRTRAEKGAEGVRLVDHPDGRKPHQIHLVLRSKDGHLDCIAREMDPSVKRRLPGKEDVARQLLGVGLHLAGEVTQRRKQHPLGGVQGNRGCGVGLHEPKNVFGRPFVVGLDCRT